MAPPTKRLGEILIEAGLMDEHQLNTALTEQKRWGGKLGEHLVRQGYVTEEALLDVLRNQLKVPTVNLMKIKIPTDILQSLPEDLIKKHKFLPVGVKNLNGKDHLVIAMSDPNNLNALDEIQFATKLKLLPALAGPIALDRAIRYYYDHQGDLFSDEEEEKDAFSPTSVRTRMEITDGSPTLKADHFGAPGKAMPNKAAMGIDSGKIDLPQMRAELTALRDLLMDKHIIDRRTFVELVTRLKGSK